MLRKLDTELDNRHIKRNELNKIDHFQKRNGVKHLPPESMTQYEKVMAIISNT